MKAGSDMRRYERIPVERPVYVTTPAEVSSVGRAYSHDLSEGGCLLVGRDFFGKGRVLILDIFLASSQPARAIGKIIHEFRNLNGTVSSGVEFQYMGDDHRGMISEYVNGRLQCMQAGTA